MTKSAFEAKMKARIQRQEKLLNRRNKKDPHWDNGLYDRYQYPVLTRDHTPLHWRFDFDFKTNPFAMERLGINCVFNSGALELNGTIYLIARVEGNDRKSFFAVAESKSGVDRFRFWDLPIVMPETDVPETNVYDMRVTQHEDGWIYGVFCTERADPKAAPGDCSAAVAQCGVARTRDLRTWERLKDIRTDSPQQRNIVLHPEFVNGKYVFYTRPQDDFIRSGSGGGIGFALADSIEAAVITRQEVIDPKQYHTIKEVKNGGGATPIKTPQGWLHIVHAVRNCAAGARYTLYALLSDLKQPNQIIARPGGHLIAPLGAERVGDVSNVVFCNGAVARKNGDLFIYYASSDTRMHVATTTIDKMVDYCLHTPEDPLRSYACVQQRLELARKNLAILKSRRRAR